METMVEVGENQSRNVIATDEIMRRKWDRWGDDGVKITSRLTFVSLPEFPCQQNVGEFQAA